LQNLECNNVPLSAESPLDGSYEAQVRSILGEHGVLTNDGWNFVTDELVDDLISWKRGGIAK
jgi:hypothetical protein